YELLCGQLPFDGPNAAAVVVQQTSTPPRPPEEIVPSLPPALSVAVLKGLAKDPRQRYPDCTTFARAVLGAAKSARRSRLAPAPAGTPPAAELACPSCGTILRLPDLAPDKKRRCPRCNAKSVASAADAGSPMKPTTAEVVKPTPRTPARPPAAAAPPPRPP